MPKLPIGTKVIPGKQVKMFGRHWALTMDKIYTILGYDSNPDGEVCYFVKDDNGIISSFHCSYFKEKIVKVRNLPDWW